MSPLMTWNIYKESFFFLLFGRQSKNRPGGGGKIQPRQWADKKNPTAQTRNGVTWLHIASRKGFKKKPLNVPNNYKIIAHIKFQPICQLKGKNTLSFLAGPLNGWPPAQTGGLKRPRGTLLQLPGVLSHDQDVL